MFSEIGEWQHDLAELWKDTVQSVTAKVLGPYNGGATSTLVLAEDRTKRPDILSGFHKYRGGWDIANKYYFAVSHYLESSSKESFD
ncbi:hypothetical protein LIER_15168 [Lithospermum erythrorhizon]|uniref:Uncharacterized protein n=1 Tax=Lithospermum erythrorhizon TaxID=34254 RepID=A0AAV3Q6E5_LITER